MGSGPRIYSEAFLRLLNTVMKRFTILTLIDITETKQYRKEIGKELEKQQQQNFAMLLQTIGLRVNPLYSRSPKLINDDLKNYSFGTAFKGKHNIWSFEFDIEYNEAFTDGAGDPTGLLLNDLHFVPVTTELNETVELRLAAFDTRDVQNRNTLVYAD